MVNELWSQTKLGHLSPLRIRDLPKSNRKQQPLSNERGKGYL